MTEQSISFAEIVQPILTEERRLDLSSRDIALLATIKAEIERNPDGLLSIPYSAIQGLSGRIDLLDVKDPRKAERRMSESMPPHADPYMHVGSRPFVSASTSLMAITCLSIGNVLNAASS